MTWILRFTQSSVCAMGLSFLPLPTAAVQTPTNLLSMVKELLEFSIVGCSKRTEEGNYQNPSSSAGGCNYLGIPHYSFSGFFWNKLYNRNMNILSNSPRLKFLPNYLYIYSCKESTKIKKWLTFFLFCIPVNVSVMLYCLMFCTVLVGGLCTGLYVWKCVRSFRCFLMQWKRLCLYVHKCTRKHTTPVFPSVIPKMYLNKRCCFSAVNCSWQCA